MKPKQQSSFSKMTQYNKQVLVSYIRCKHNSLVTQALVWNSLPSFVW